MTLFILLLLDCFTDIFADVLTVATAVIAVADFILLFTELCAVIHVMFFVFCAGYQ